MKRYLAISTFVLGTLAATTISSTVYAGGAQPWKIHETITLKPQTVTPLPPGTHVHINPSLKPVLPLKPVAKWAVEKTPNGGEKWIPVSVNSNPVGGGMWERPGARYVDNGMYERPGTATSNR